MYGLADLGSCADLLCACISSDSNVTVCLQTCDGLFPNVKQSATAKHGLPAPLQYGQALFVFLYAYQAGCFLHA